jgi:hypothetical protein
MCVQRGDTHLWANHTLFQISSFTSCFSSMFQSCRLSSLISLVSLQLLSGCEVVRGGGSETDDRAAEGNGKGAPLVCANEFL